MSVPHLGGGGFFSFRINFKIGKYVLQFSFLFLDCFGLGDSLNSSMSFKINLPFLFLNQVWFSWLYLFLKINLKNICIFPLLLS